MSQNKCTVTRNDMNKHQPDTNSTSLVAIVTQKEFKAAVNSTLIQNHG